MQDKKAEPLRKGKVIRLRPSEKTKPTAESLERLRRTAEEKGWMKKPTTLHGRRGPSFPRKRESSF